MAVREFTDSKDVDWQVWDVTPAHLHPVTRGEDYMGNLQDGWLAFQSGNDRRRLAAPYPADWITLPLAELEELLRRSAPIVRRRARTPSGERRAISAAEIESGAIAHSDSRHTFRSPGGRDWTVRIHECLDRDGEHEVVLRFTADDIVVELTRWPKNWRSASVEEFAMMLLDANPPRRLPKGRGPQRRREDRGD
jgi:hypothetical protein